MLHGGTSRVEIRFDDGLWSYGLGPAMGRDGEGLSDREARRVLRRWAAREPGRGQLRRFAAAELQVEARTEDGLVERVWALLEMRGVRLWRVPRMGLAEAFEVVEGDIEDSTGEDARSTTWIEIQLTDPLGNAVPRVRFEARAGYSVERSGRVDDEGIVRLDDLPDERYWVELPEHPRGLWYPEGAPDAEPKDSDPGWSLQNGQLNRFILRIHEIVPVPNMLIPFPNSGHDPTNHCIRVELKRAEFQIERFEVSGKILKEGIDFKRSGAYVFFSCDMLGDKAPSGKIFVTEELKKMLYLLTLDSAMTVNDMLESLGKQIENTEMFVEKVREERSDLDDNALDCLEFGLRRSANRNICEALEAMERNLSNDELNEMFENVDNLPLVLE